MSLPPPPLLLPSHHSDPPPPGCVKLAGTLVASLATGACKSPIGYCTAGELRDEKGRLIATTSYVALAASPGGGMLGTESDSAMSYSGTLSIQSEAGSATFRDF